MSKMRFFALQELANRRPVKVDYPSEKLADYYGNHVFDRKKMQEYLPSEAYKAVINAIEKGTPINREMADMIANGMKNWANTTTGHFVQTQVSICSLLPRLRKEICFSLLS